MARATRTRDPNAGLLHQNEYVDFKTRRHWFSIISRGGLLFVFAVLAIIVAIVLLFSPLEGWLKAAPVTLLLLFAVVYIGWRILDWTNDYFIITNQRVIFIDKVIGVREQRSEAPMNKVHNVRIDYHGQVAHLLDYADLALDTAGIGVLSFTMLPHPRLLRDRIMSVRRQVNQEALPVRENRRRDILANHLAGQRDPNDRPMEEPMVVPQNTGMSGINTVLPFRPQRQGETVVWHQHWIILFKGELKPIGTFLLVIILWILTNIILSRFVTPPDPYALPNLNAGDPNALLDTVGRVFGIVMGVLIIPLLAWIWYIYEDWRNDKYSLTHDKVLTVYKKPLGGRETVIETMFGRITDVSYSIDNPIAMMFNYGDVVVKTPGEATAFLFKDVPDPRAVQQEITTRLEAHRAREAAQWDNDIVDWLKVFNTELERRTPQLIAEAVDEVERRRATNPNSPDAPTRQNNGFFDF